MKTRENGNEMAVESFPYRRILLFGASGQVGTALSENLALQNLFAPTSELLNLHELSDQTTAIYDYAPDLVINAAAFHRVPECEHRFSEAVYMNVVVNRDLAAICSKLNAAYVTFSSDYVFDGDKGEPYSEDDRVGPIQMYGISRVGGEFVVISQALSRFLIVRTAGVFGFGKSLSKGLNFVEQRIADITRGADFEISSEQTVSPTYAGHLAKGLVDLIAHPECPSGLFHLVNEGQCTWHELTCYLADKMNSDVRVIPVDRGCKTGDMRRPRNSALKNTKARALGIVLPDWKAAIDEYLSRRDRCRAI